MVFVLGHIWNNGRHQRHSIVIGQGYWTRMLDKIVGQVRRHSSTTSHSSYFVGATIWITPSSTFVFNNYYIIYYTDYSSAVGLVRIACRLSMWVSRFEWCLPFVTTLQSSSSSDATHDWSWSNTTPRLHTVPFLIQVHHAHCTVQCLHCVCFCIASWQCPPLFSDVAKYFWFKLHSCVLVCLYAMA